MAPERGPHRELWEQTGLTKGAVGNEGWPLSADIPTSCLEAFLLFVLVLEPEQQASELTETDNGSSKELSVVTPGSGKADNWRKYWRKRNLT